MTEEQSGATVVGPSEAIRTLDLADAMEWASFLANEWVECDKLLDKLGYPSMQNERFVHMADRIRALAHELVNRLEIETEEEE